MCEEHEARIRELENELNKANEKIIKLERENEELKRHLIEFKSMLEKHQSIIEQTFKPDRKKRQKKPGAKPGHKGYSRPLPDHVNEEVDLSLRVCPDCGSELSETQQIYPHYVEDIMPPQQSYVKKYNIHKKYCTECKKLVYPKPIDVIPNCRFGLTLMLFVCFQKFGLALPYNKIAFELLAYFGIKVSEGELCQMVQKIAELFGDKFDELKEKMKRLNAVNVDETGWRINGRNQWLWAFISKEIAMFKISKSRSRKVAEDFLGDFDGVVGTDFYPSYDSLIYEQQKCWVHLLRETSKLAKKDDASYEAKEMHKKLKRLHRDAKRFKESNPNDNEKEYAVKRFLKRLDIITGMDYNDENCQRIAKRLLKNRENMFRFIYMDDVEPDNNGAERGIRPHVVIEKISGGNRSEKGARAHEVMMSIIETYKLQGLNFFEKGISYLQNQLTTGE
jgi:transposase-like protein